MICGTHPVCFILHTLVSKEVAGLLHGLEEPVRFLCQEQVLDITEFITV